MEKERKKIVEIKFPIRMHWEFMSISWGAIQNSRLCPVHSRGGARIWDTLGDHHRASLSFYLVAVRCFVFCFILLVWHTQMTQITDAEMQRRRHWSRYNRNRWERQSKTEWTTTTHRPVVQMVFISENCKSWRSLFCLFDCFGSSAKERIREQTIRPSIRHIHMWLKEREREKQIFRCLPLATYSV